MHSHIPEGIIPIRWFGDRWAYKKSTVKVVTVGLNPSDREFREKNEMTFSTELRFPAYHTDQKRYVRALNHYFKENPYSWFNAFEKVLNGMGASYYDNDDFPARALHTDICSPWATSPTWSELPKAEKDALYAEGHPQWIKLIKALKPDIIVASVANEHIARLGIENTKSEFCRFKFTKNRQLRNAPEIIWMYEYQGIPLINGRTRNTPFGSLSTEYKQAVGRKIKEFIMHR